MSKKIGALYVVIFLYLGLLFYNSKLLNPYKGSPLTKLDNGFYKIIGMGCLHGGRRYYFSEEPPSDVTFSKDVFSEWGWFDKIDIRMIVLQSNELKIVLKGEACSNTTTANLYQNDQGLISFKPEQEINEQRKEFEPCSFKKNYRGKTLEYKYHGEVLGEESVTDLVPMENKLIFKDPTTGQIYLYDKEVSDLRDRGCLEKDSKIVILEYGGSL